MEHNLSEKQLLAREGKESEDQVYRLKAHIEDLTGHAYDCEIQVDHEWKPCTCGRG